MTKTRRHLIGTVLKTIVGTLAVHIALVLLMFGAVNPEGVLWGRSFPTVTAVTRATKLALLDGWHRSAPVEGFILGSSRSFNLEPDAFTKATGHRFFNYSVSSGMLEDVDAFLTMVEQRYRHRPRELVISVDPVMLTDWALPAELTDSWVFAPIIERREPTTGWKILHAVHLIRKALTPQYAREVGMSIMAKLRNRASVHFFHADGRIEYKTRNRAIAEGRYDRAGFMERCIRGFADSLLATHRFDAASLKRIALLDSLLARAQAAGIRVVVWMPPSHPTLQATYAKFPVADAWLLALPRQVAAIAARHGASFVDLSRVEYFDGDPNEFYDCVHFGSANAAKITAILLANRPPALNVAPSRQEP